MLLTPSFLNSQATDHIVDSSRAVDEKQLERICAAALSVPSKGDFQQADIVIIRDPAVRRDFDGLMPSQSWLPSAPAMLVVCANGRRQRLISEWHQQEFANDHLDAFFNTATDAALLLGWLIVAAEAEGLGTCPLSALRNRIDEVSDLLKLPDFVFPYAGLALGWPASQGSIVPRLPLAATLHVDRFADRDIRELVRAYDERRADIESRADGSPVGSLESWSYSKARANSRPQREHFGDHVRRNGFNLA